MFTQELNLFRRNFGRSLPNLKTTNQRQIHENLNQRRKIARLLYNYIETLAAAPSPSPLLDSIKDLHESSIPKLTPQQAAERAKTRNPASLVFKPPVIPTPSLTQEELTRLINLYQDLNTDVPVLDDTKKLIEWGYFDLQLGVIRRVGDRIHRWMEEFYHSKNLDKLAARVERAKKAVVEVDVEFQAKGCCLWPEIAGDFPWIDELVAEWHEMKGFKGKTYAKEPEEEEVDEDRFKEREQDEKKDGRKVFLKFKGIKKELLESVGAGEMGASIDGKAGDDNDTGEETTSSEESSSDDEDDEDRELRLRYLKVVEL